jgi:hypothetical protein
MKKKQVTTQKHYSPRAILVAIGAKIRALKLQRQCPTTDGAALIGEGGV